MEQNTDKLIQGQFAKLPSNVQQAIGAVPWKALVQEIGKENALDTEQILALEQETMFIIYAFEPPEDYVANIVREVDIAEDAANKIAVSMAEKVFEPILIKAEEMKEENTPTTSEITTEIHPVVEEGEKAHDTTPEEKKFMNMGDVQTLASDQQEIQTKPPIGPQPPTEPQQPKQPSYPGGKDPYREPI